MFVRLLRRVGVLSIALACLAEAVLGQDAAPPLQLAPAVDGPRESDKPLAKALVAEFENRHASMRKLDDELSKRWLDLYVQTFDPLKIYFHQSDIDAFERVATQLDDFAREGDLRFAYVVFEIYLRRMDEAHRLIEELLAESHDFAVNETYVTDSRRVAYARDNAELRERWRKRIKHDLLSAEAKGLDPAAAARQVSERYQAQRRNNYRINDNELVEHYFNALCAAFDANSRFWSPETFEDFRVASQGSLTGIGAELAQEGRGLLVKKIVPGGPAAHDGRLKVGDYIVGIGQGDSGPIEPIADRRLRDCIGLIRGANGSTVRLQVVSGSEEPVIYDLTRAPVSLNELKSNVLEVKRGDREPLRIGYVDLSSFYGSLTNDPTARNTTNDLQKALQGFGNVDLVMIDLRQNGGGSIVQSVETAALLVPTGPIFQSRSRGQGTQPHMPTTPLPVDGFNQFIEGKQPAAGRGWHGPLVVLTSRSTAGGAEILAGAVQDYDRGLIIGDGATIGMGVVGNLIEMGQVLVPGENYPNRGASKITHGGFYRLTGGPVQGQGVAPDVVLPAMSSIRSASNGPSYPLAVGTVERAEFPRLKYGIDQRLRDDLAKQSQKRRDALQTWSELTSQISRRQAAVNVTDIPLEREAFRRWYADSRGPEVDPAMPADDAFLDEAKAIAVDYLGRLQLARAERSAADKRFADAKAQYAKTIDSDPENREARNSLAWMLATCTDKRQRDAKQAVELAEWVCSHDEKPVWQHLLTLTVALSETGDYESALKRLDEVLAAAPPGQAEKYRYLKQQYTDKAAAQKSKS